MLLNADVERPPFEINDLANPQSNCYHSSAHLMNKGHSDVDRKFHQFTRYLIATIGVAGATVLLIPFREHINSTTIALIFLLVVLFIARLFGSLPALFTSLLAAFSLNFFFLPPFYTLTIAEPQNWIALFVFLSVAVTVGQLSATAKNRAEVAENLYKELQSAFEQASQAEALKRSEKLKSSLLDAVTHDLRTPLTSIKAATTMLLEEHGKDAIHRTLNPERRGDLLEVIDEETDRLNSFVESMVELARLEAGDVNWRRTPVTVDEIIANALQRASGITRNHHVKVKVEPNLPTLKVGPKAIAEVLYNLIDNAVKYSDIGSEIMIRSDRVNRTVRFSVDDKGIGIPLGERENVFQKFYRSDKTSKGFGMGLAIANGIIEAHGGRIWIEDADLGSRFVFELPIEVSNE